MGNTLVVTNGDKANGGLATVAVSKYLKLTKSNIVVIRNILAEHATPRDRKVGRPVFQMALDRAAVRKSPDQQVLHHLFTMWATVNISADTSESFDCTPGGNEHKVRYRDFIVGLSPLACGGESLTSVLSFAMRIMDKRKGGVNTSSKMMNSNQLIFMLKNINDLCTYFGDETLCMRQIHKIVDNVFDTITMISDDPQDLLSHDEIIDSLVQEPLVQKVAFNKLRSGGSPRPNSTSPVSDHIEQLYSKLHQQNNNNNNRSAAIQSNADNNSNNHHHHHSRGVQRISTTANEMETANTSKKNGISRYLPEFGNGNGNGNGEVIGKRTRLVEEEVSQVSSVLLSPLPVLHAFGDNDGGLISL